MASKQLVYSDEARQKLLSGVGKLARAVRATLGPRGRNAVLDKGWGSPNVTNEGVYREGLKMIAAGHDPMALTRGVQKGVDKVVEELHRLAEKIDAKDEKEITEVATIASNNNPEIGQKLAEAMREVGAN